MLGSALAKNEDVGVKQIEFVVGVNVGAEGLRVMCFVGVVGALCTGGGGIGVVGGVLGGGLAMCRRVKRLRCFCLKRAICCWCCVPEYCVLCSVSGFLILS